MDKFKNVSGQLWKNFIKCASLFTSFCGTAGAFISLVNAVSPATLSELPTKSKAKTNLTVK